MTEFESNYKPDEDKSANELPKNHPDRISIAAQIKEARKIDRNSHPQQREWIDFRHGWQYAEALCGISATLNYVKNHSVNKTVLDIGSGSSIGISDIAKSELGQGLIFQATTLTPNKHHANNLGKENIRLTSAEVLKGVTPQSIDCVISVHSLTYSIKPELSVKRIDQILTQGGVLKVLLVTKEDNSKYGTDSKLFIKTLKELGYDVASMTPVEEGRERNEIILAIKPNKNSQDKTAPSAENLLQDDLSTMAADANLLTQERQKKLKTKQHGYPRD